MKLIKYGFLLILIYFIVCNIVIYIYAEKKPSQHAQTMVILGSQVIGTPAIASPTLADRLDVAVQYLNQNPETKVVVCGGQGEDESATEASVMAKYLIDKGIEANRVYQEDKSRRTAEQFIFANRVLPLDKTVVVTNDFHILRSIMLAKRSGVHDVSGLSAPLAFNNGDKYVALIREPLALANSWLFDHPSDNTKTTN
ncbi:MULTISPECIES: YdcF family protein [Gilliamella]|uniref:YdcF family protein n=1 Tax=Gilliamella TaxID=1193503 RepID=UPI00155430EA|nr:MULTISPECIES: YdcF family protein [Gilliamella]MBI0030251.1 YdcF family protein [Gilliamella sp. B14384G15]MBI0057117.1 YdcF family protein [Gilliamella sp. B14384G12]